MLGESDKQQIEEVGNKIKPENSEATTTLLSKSEFVLCIASPSLFRDIRTKILKNQSNRQRHLFVFQSMLFPAVLLTTISLLGFYLPPDSGERIGLQITILLTFMVFILTVGDMFPASTGPYLGVYFVLCMALLGLNIVMTVLVLYLHYMQTDLVIKTDQNTVRVCSRIEGGCTMPLPLLDFVFS